MAAVTLAFHMIIEPYEGLYSNDAADAGGETVYGLTRKDDADWDGWIVVDRQRKQPNFPANLQLCNPGLISLAVAYYKKHYWDVLLLDQVNDQKLANELFDIAVNMGTGTAATFLQRVLNALNRKGKDYPDIVVDGIVGNKTIATLNNHKSPRNVLLAINALQGAKYMAICEANPSQEVFMNGWIQRCTVA